jgi:hypothetical protein
MEIARNPVLSDPTHVSHLPPSWGTLHALAKLPKATLEAKIADGTIHPKLERKDVAKLNPETPDVDDVEDEAPEEGTARGKTVSLSFTHEPAEPKRVLLNITHEKAQKTTLSPDEVKEIVQRIKDAKTIEAVPVEPEGDADDADDDEPSSDKTVSAKELAEKLNPIIDALMIEGKKNIATISLSAILRQAGLLKNLLEEWTTPAKRKTDRAVKAAADRAEAK